MMILYYYNNIITSTLVEIETKKKHFFLFDWIFTGTIVVELVFVIIKFSSVKLNGSRKKVYLN